MYNSVVALSQSLNIPACLKDAGISEEAYLNDREAMLAKALADVCTTTNPVAVGYEEMKAVMDLAYYGE
jgi:alcohol dehydrogenase class IV